MLAGILEEGLPGRVGMRVETYRKFLHGQAKIDENFINASTTFKNKHLIYKNCQYIIQYRVRISAAFRH